MCCWIDAGNTLPKPKAGPSLLLPPKSPQILPELKSGELVAILTAGAYGAVMSSAYNARPPAPEVLVKGHLWSVVRPRQDDDALLRSEHIPDWLAG